MLRIAVFVFGWLALPGSVFAAEQWMRYVNERFGVSAQHPADWKPARPPENGDGLRFTSPDGSAFVSISGSLQTFETNTEFLDIVAQEQGARITLVKRGSRSIVVSGLRGDRIFYKRSFLACKDQVWNSLVIEYPAPRKAEFDALVARVSRSLKSGQGYQVTCS